MQKRYWLRGGFIILGLYVLLGILIAIYELGIAPQNEMSGLGTMLYIIGPGQLIFGIDGPQEYIFAFIFSTSIYFISGALLGLIYEKNKRIIWSLIALVFIVGIIFGYLQLTENERPAERPLTPGEVRIYN